MAKLPTLPKKPREIAKQKIIELAKKMYDDLMKGKRPKITMPIRSLSNAMFDKEKGSFTLVGKEKARTLTVNQAKIFAQNNNNIKGISIDGEEYRLNTICR